MAWTCRTAAQDRSRHYVVAVATMPLLALMTDIPGISQRPLTLAELRECEQRMEKSR